ncbi:cyclase family protein [uncultured Pseudomonas sp.]|uniref:cyclase family protein n=1 Tax=uncultured Pseudomonas sp. TaxID=114707 RepID=UPI00338EB179
MTLADVQAWEKHHGPIPAGAFVASRIDWSQRWPDETLIQSLVAQGMVDCPGCSREVLSTTTELTESPLPIIRLRIPVRVTPLAVMTVLWSLRFLGAITTRSNYWPTWTKPQRPSP